MQLRFLEHNIESRAFSPTLCNERLLSTHVCNPHHPESSLGGRRLTFEQAVRLPAMQLHRPGQGLQSFQVRTRPCVTNTVLELDARCRDMSRLWCSFRHICLTQQRHLRATELRQRARNRAALAFGNAWLHISLRDHQACPQTDVLHLTSTLRS